MLIEEFDDLTEVIDFVKSSPNIVCNINQDLKFPISKKYGYKIFVITIDQDDPAFVPDEYHGDRIYTFLSPKFKDCKSISTPIHMSQIDRDFFIDNFMDDESYKLFIGQGYVNLIVSNSDYEKIRDRTVSCLKYIIVSDSMYNKRSSALTKLLNILETN